MFHAVDTNGDGRVDFTEAVAAACGVCASMSEAQAKAWFIALDTSDSGCIDEKEYVVGMTTLTNPLSDAEFATAVKKTIGRTQKKVKHPRYYFHESETRGYLGKDLVPLLEKGLESLLRQVEQERVKVASGELWDKDGYAPEEWRAMRPLQFLGRFLLDHSKKGLQRKAKQESQEAMKSEAKQKAAEFEARGGAPLPYTELTRTEKLEMCFRAIDKNRDAYITVDEMALVCKKLNPPGRGNREAGIRTQSESNDSGMSAAVNSGMGTAAENAVRWMDVNGDGKVSLEEYETAMTELLENVDDAVFDAGVVHLLDSVKFAEADRREKLKMVFDKTDVDGNGTLDVEELRHLARQLVVGGDEAAVKRTMKWLDVNEDSVVSFDEFCEVRPWAFPKSRPPCVPTQD
jgi:Ca2+-binding EF-hand superfamily protein